ncbi:hypothetical protein FOA52_003020 [Chlamydomonas sp. UWO 241]|nr:hypothetical protein FOA52_003020 [Chlamydomonas sp. UWO 241]
MIVILAMLGLFVLMILYWVATFRRGKRLALVQYFINLKKRVDGEPTSGLITIINTDIEGYSDLMKRSPKLMTRALILHNAAIRQARWATYGSTVEQEGDSYSLCFSDPMDAAMFCLMTQQLLMQQPWPHGLFRTTSSGGGGARAAKKSFIQLMMSKISAVIARMSAIIFGTRPPASNISSTQPAVALHSAALPSPNGHCIDTKKSKQQPDGNNSSSSSSGCDMFNGLRVRMGIATEQLAEGTAVRVSAVMESAKVIADAGAGGQVLMDEATFSIVKGRLEELAAVDAEGMNDDVLNDLRPPWWMFWRYHDGMHKAQAGALVLDMGTYVHTASKVLPAVHSYGLSTAHSGTARRMSLGARPAGRKVSADGVVSKSQA